MKFLIEHITLVDAEDMDAAVQQLEDAVTAMGHSPTSFGVLNTDITVAYEIIEQ